MAEERPGELGPLPSARIYEIARNLGHRSPHPYHVCLYLDELHALLSSASRLQPSAAPGVDRPPPCWAADGPFRCSREYGHAGQHHDIFSSHSGHVWDNEQPSAPERPFDRVWPLSGSGSAPRESDPDACEYCDGTGEMPNDCAACCGTGRRESDPSASSERTYGEAKETGAHEATGDRGDAQGCSGGGVARPADEAPVRTEVARPTNGGVPDPLPEVLPAGAKLRASGESCAGWTLNVTEFDRVYLGPGGARFVDLFQIDWSSVPNPPPAPLTSNDGTGGQQAGREELHFCDYTTGPFICEGDACNGHTVKEMRAYDAGRASLAKRINAPFFIWRDSFRWKRLLPPGEGRDFKGANTSFERVISNAYESFSAETVCRDNGWEILREWPDFAIVRELSAAGTKGT